MDEYKGLYAYLDTKNNNEMCISERIWKCIKKIRHNQHYQPSKYDDQRINQILQCNPQRYAYNWLD